MSMKRDHSQMSLNKYGSHLLSITQRLTTGLEVTPLVDRT